MSKAEIGGLFFKERGLRLPVAIRGWAGITISERALRNLITTLIVLFLLTLGLALALQLIVSRNNHVAQHNRLSVLFLSVASQSLGAALSKGLDQGGTLREPQREDLIRALPDGATRAGRVYAIVDSRGLIAASLPASDKLDGLALAEIFDSSDLPHPSAGQPAVKAMTLAAGSKAYVIVGDLAPYPASLVLMQPHDQVLLAWTGDVFQVTTLFIVTLSVLVLLGAAFHWQAARAAEADRTLAGATDRLDKALDRGRCGLWDWDVSRGQIFWSKSMYDILGLRPRGEFLSYGEVAERLHEDDDPIDRMVDIMLEGGKPAIDQEFRMRHRDGHWVWLRARAELTSGAEPDSHHLVGIAIDVTDQKIADKLNQEAELRLKDAIENISEAFVLWDADNRMVMCNSKYQQFHNLPASVCAPGTRYEDMAKAAREPLVRQRMQVQPSEAGEGNTYEVQLGDTQWLQINERRTKDGGFVSVGTDITPLKQHEERLLSSERELMNTVRDLQKSRMELEQQSQRLAELAEKYSEEKTRAESANRSKTEFLANMSHELRTPLNAIIGFSEVMEQEILGPVGTDRYVGYAADIHRSGQYLLDVISDILDMSKIEAGRVTLETGLCDMSSIIEDAMRLIAPRAQEGDVRVVTDVAQDTHVMADDRAIKQVLINIMANAVKFTPEGGTVTVKAAGAETDFRISVADTGIGIPAEDLGKLGQPFVQVENQLTKTRAGSGLGLAISRSLVELHGGKLEITSVENQGTTVTIVLPLKSDASPAEGNGLVIEPGQHT